MAVGADPVIFAAVDPAQAREEARRILAGRRYKGSPVPRPLRGVLRWIGDRLAAIGHWFGDRFSWVPVSARPWVEVAALIVVALVIGVVVKNVLTARAQARAARLGSDGGMGGKSIRAGDPAALEAAAAEAEARGDLALAVRLRFRAGLVRLDRDAHAIAYRDSIPTGDVRVELSLPAFDELADAFEDIAYGGRDADATDAAEARREWPGVVHAARRR